METCPEQISAIILGIKKGLKRGVPSPLAYPKHSSWKVCKPPIPDPQTTPSLSGSNAFGPSSPASFTAWMAEHNPYCEKTSILRASLRSRYSSGLKPFTSQANCVLNLEASKRV